MDKKILYLSIIVVILIAIVGFMGVSKFSNNGNSEFKVGDTLFALPGSYIEGTPVGDTINITDGYYCLYMNEINETDIEKEVYSYVKDRREKNETVELSNITVDNVFVYKTTNRNSGANHYWFKNKDNVYTVFNWEQNIMMDKITIDLIKSMK